MKTTKGTISLACERAEEFGAGPKSMGQPSSVTAPQGTDEYTL